MTAPRPRPGPTPARRIATAALGAAALIGLLAWEASRTRPVRQALAAYNRLISAANGEDLDAVARLYSARYLRDAPPRPAPHGGVVGLPRNGPNKNFRAWRRGDDVLICPTARDVDGPIYRFVPEGNDWKYDGLEGLLHPDGKVDPMPSADESGPGRPAASFPGPPFRGSLAIMPPPGLMPRLRPRVKVWLEAEGSGLGFGSGLIAILQAVERRGSIEGAAAELGRSYRHVRGRIKRAESAFGRPLVEARVGGRGPSRSGLSEDARWLIRDFLALRARLMDAMDDASSGFPT